LREKRSPASLIRSSDNNRNATITLSEKSGFEMEAQPLREQPMAPTLFTAAVLVHTTPGPQQPVQKVRYLPASQEEFIGVIGKYDSKMAPTPPSVTIHGPFANPAEL
jgi:hypothetical protein